MIERIMSIQNLGRFSNHRARGDITMRRLTTFFGQNGRGKTTLCALFRSLQSGDTVALSARKTLGQPHEPSAEIRVNKMSVKLENGKWSEILPELAIFDSEFVSQNVYTGDHILRDNKRNSFHVIIGARGIQLARQIEQFDEEIRALNSEIRDLRAQVQRHITGNISVEDFLQISEVENIDDLIQEIEEQSNSLMRAIEQTTQIQRTETLKTLEAPVLPDGIAEILAKTITEISDEVETRVREHIAGNLDTEGESWLAQGNVYALGPNCPFCGQDLGQSELIDLYRAYFSDEYRRLKQDVASLRERVANALSSNNIIRIIQLISKNNELIGFWRQFIHIESSQIPLDKLQADFQQAEESMGKAISEKENKPLDVIQMPPQWDAAQATVNEICNAVNLYNQSITHTNEDIERFKSSQPQRDIADLKMKLERLKMVKKRHEPQVANDFNCYAEATEKKSKIEGEKNKTRDELNQFCHNIFEEHQNSINRYLRQFNASFRIIREC